MCDPPTYTMGHPDFIACSSIENSIGLNRVERQVLGYIKEQLLLQMSYKTVF